MTGGIIGVWFVAALLSAGGGTAHAADLPVAPAPLPASSDMALEAVGDEASVTTPVFDATAGAMAAAAADAPLGSAIGVDVVESAGSLQASPSSVSASANRRAIIDDAVADAGLASLPIAEEAPAVAPAPHVEPAAPEQSAPLSLTPPAVPLGTPDGRADSGPSGAHLAVITAALMAVVLLTQQLHSDAHRWRSVRVSTRIERPG